MQTRAFLRAGVSGLALLALPLALAGCGGGGGGIPFVVDDYPLQGYAGRVTALIDTGEKRGDGVEIKKVHDISVGDPDEAVGAKIEEDSAGNITAVTIANAGQTLEFGNCQGTECTAAEHRLYISQPKDYSYTWMGLWESKVPANTRNVTFTVKSGVVGQKTASMPQTGTARYEGGFALDAYSRLTNTDEGYAGTMTLYADFGRKSFTAQFKDAAGDLDLRADRGRISGATLSADLSGRIGGESATGAMKGMFYGPKAEEIGGALKVQSVNREGGGIFFGKRR